MTTQLDRDLLDAAADATDAIGDGTTLTESARLRAALQLLVNRTTTARDTLADRVRATETDTSQGRRAALEFDQAVERGVATYRNLQTRARGRLVDLDPDQADELGAAEVQTRADFFASAFGFAPSDFPRIGRVAIRGRLADTLQRLAERPDYIPDDDRQRLAAAVERIDAAHARQRDEQRDDAELFDQLEAARDETRRQTRALRTLAEAVLLSDDAANTLDDLLQRARRRRAAPSPTDTQPPQPAPTEPEPV